MEKQERIEKEKLLRKNLILDAAVKTFARLGYDRTTVNDIAREAGYSKSNLYFYFKNKDEILFELIEDVIRYRAEELRKLVEFEEKAIDKLRRFIKKAFDYVQSHRELMCILYSEQEKLHVFEKEEKFRSLIMNDKIEAIKALTAIFNKGMKSGEFEKEDPQKNAILFLSMIGGAIVHWIHSNNEVNLDEYESKIINILQKGMI